MLKYNIMIVGTGEDVWSDSMMNEVGPNSLTGK
jgi:hypothetical protein